MSTGQHLQQSSNEAWASAAVYAGILLVVALVVWVPGPTPVGDPPAETRTGTTVAVEGGVCSSADDLLGRHLPQRALGLVTEIRAGQASSEPPACGDQRSRAVVAIAQADALAAEAGRLTDPEAASAAADEALAIDAENVAALAVKDQPAAHPVADAFADDLGSSPTQLARLLLTAGILAALAVLARLLTSVGLRWPRLSADGARACLGVGSAIAAIGALAMTSILTGGRGTWWELWAAIAWALVGAGAMAVGLATRLRLSVDARDSSGAASSAAAARLLARLSELGTEPPRGLEAPQGADVDVLGGAALDGLPEGRWARVLVGLARSLLAQAPWRVAVDELASGGVVVAITRNGRAVRSVTVEPTLLGFDDSDDGKKALAAADLYRAVAAVVLVTLDEHHAGLSVGLCGARDWRSLGLQAVATGDFGQDEQRMRDLLAHAVDLDPDSWLAKVALHHAMWRRSIDADELRRYGAWLDKAIGATADYPTVQLRLHLTRVLASVNEVCATTKGRPTRGDLTGLVPHVTALVKALGPSGRRDVVAPEAALPVSPIGPLPASLVEPIKPLAGTLVALVAESDQDVSDLRAWVEGWPGPASPRAHYTAGCTQATISLLPAKDPAKDPAKATVEAIEHFHHARALPEVRAWIDKDPQLTEFVKLPAYRAAFPLKPRADLLALTPIVAHAKRLDALGLADAALLAAVTPAVLADGLGVLPVRAEQLVDLAGLRRSMPTGRLDTYGVEVLHELLVRGKADGRTLGRLGAAEIDSLAQALARAVVEVYPTMLADGTLEDATVTTDALRAAIVTWLTTHPW